MSSLLRISTGRPVVIDTSVALDAELVTADRKQAATASCRVRLIGQ